MVPFLNMKKEEYIMFARLSIGQTKSENIDELIRIYKESIIPATKLQNGIRGSYLLANRETGKVIAIAFWDREEDAADEQSGYYQELSKTKYLLTAVPVCEIYEVSAQL